MTWRLRFESPISRPVATPHGTTLDLDNAINIDAESQVDSTYT